ncbi:LysR family transcriptional regulator [Nonomuraea roseoviolacea]|uniref:DNA-binding transcriptional LysR family regulator n=1 Tax=Nonomuraea roseoviolacea subsp. carminata TaxID=160689 RepID=A0ABT1K0U9_9ACTN|nr:LysR family transcriptional regulator [Nonomuraea roseoviolacea]MCP2347292.1 DNA-binding transcriptional LysR family regulator [Nonomuraea roseoviolacea subsp. carminata]
MDTRLLRSFLAVVRTGGMTSAAAEQGFVQSTITAHVQALERLTGARLLERRTGGVVPTPAGSLLAERARQLLDLEERMLAELTAEADRLAGPVRLCAPDSVCAYQLAPVLPELRRRFPDVRVSLFPATTRAALAALADHSADLALVLEPSADPPDADVTGLGEQELVLVGTAAADLPRDRALTPADLAAAGVLLLEEGCGYSDELAGMVAAVAQQAAPSRFGSIETVKRCVEAGLGLALLPAVTVAGELAEGRLVALRPPAVAPQRLWLVRRRSRWLSPAAEAVQAALEKLLRR